MRFDIITLGLALAVPPTENPSSYHVAISLIGDTCSVHVDGQRVDMEAGDGNGKQLLKLLPDKTRPIEFGGDVNVPYRCAGGVMVALQREGFSKFSFDPSWGVIQTPK